MNVQRIAVCQASDLAAINARIAAATHPVHGYGYGPNNVSIPLSASGAEPATHYASSAWYDEPMLAQLAGLMGDFPSASLYATWAAVEAAGLRRISSVTP